MDIQTIWKREKKFVSLQDGQTPLHYNSKARNIAIVNTLISKAADVNMQDEVCCN